MLFQQISPPPQKLPITTLYFNILLYYNTIYTTPLIIFQLFLFILKYNSLTYQTSTIAAEVILLILVFILNLYRLNLGFIVNKNKHLGKFIIYLIFSIIVLLGFVYVVVWQNWIYWFEFVGVIIGIVVVGLEVLCGVVGIIVAKVME